MRDGQARPETRTFPRVRPPADWRVDPLRPPVVIGIPNWNRRDLLEECVESLLRFTNYPHYRICIFDQGSTDGSRERILEWGERVDPILHAENVGFVLANNAIVDRYAGWDVLFLNNDTRITQSDWLGLLVATAYSAADIGLVGAKLVYPNGQLQEAGSQLYRNGSARALGKFEDPDDPQFNVRRDVDFCSAACLYVKREVLDRCGAFETCYCPSYYEDVDLALKAAAAGYRTVCEPTVVVVHNEYGSSGKAMAAERMIRNQKIFAERWRDVLESRPLSLWQLPPSDRRQVLVLGTATEDDPNRTARVRLLIETLARDYQLAYAHMDAGTTDRRLRLPDVHGAVWFHAGFARAVGSDLLDLGAILLHNRFRWAVFDRPETLRGWERAVREYSPDARIALDVALDEWCVEPPGDPNALLAGTATQRDRILRVDPKRTVALIAPHSGVTVEIAPRRRPVGLFAFMRRTSRGQTTVLGDVKIHAPTNLVAAPPREAKL